MSQYNNDSTLVVVNITLTFLPQQPFLFPVSHPEGNEFIRVRGFNKKSNYELKEILVQKQGLKNGLMLYTSRTK